MKRDDSVFFFTLVDFLVTALFFGLVLYAMEAQASAASGKNGEDAVKALERLGSATGVSNLTELTDRLTRLGPVKDVEKAVTSVRQAGGLAEIEKGQSLIKNAGGLDSVSAALVRLRRQEGYGQPPCLFTLASNGRKIASNFASVRATDSIITFKAPTAALDTILNLLGRSYASVKTLALPDFRRTFAPLPNLRPDCRYSIEFIEQTRYVDARDAAKDAFRLNIVKP